MDLALLRKFYIVALEGNITNASKSLNMTQSSLSRAIHQFEHQMKAKLFIRTKNGVELTAQGERIFHHASIHIPEHDLFCKHFFENENQVEGDLNIIAYPYIGANLLPYLLQDFLELYPSITIKIHIDSDNINPINHDVAIGTFLPNLPNLIQKEIIPVHTYFFASKKYLNDYGTPSTPEDLNKHRLITYKDRYSYATNRSINLLLHIGNPPQNPPRKPYFEVDALNGMVNAALLGYGIAELPNYPTILTLDLERVLPDITGENIPLCIMYQKNRKNSKKIQVLTDYLTERLKMGKEYSTICKLV